MKTLNPERGPGKPMFVDAPPPPERPNTVIEHFATEEDIVAMKRLLARPDVRRLDAALKAGRWRDQ